MNPFGTAISPSSITILPTYRCTAACEQCCFESNPTLQHRLSLDTILARIDEAHAVFADLKLVVFSGGEAFLLKDDLFAAIAHASSKGLAVRCVTNGFWGKRAEHARKTVARLVDAGISEINISTGLDHQRWVPLSSVENACAALVERGVTTLLTVEADAPDSRCVEAAFNSPVIAALLKEAPLHFSFQSNSWMAFNDGYQPRGQAAGLEGLTKGCDQLFNNIVITPHDEMSACCGLTFEHIPEMKLGRPAERPMRELFDESAGDFLKIWLHVDGPGEILRRLFGESVDDAHRDVRHICEACTVLHKDPAIRDALRSRYQEFVPEVLPRWHSKMTLRILEGARDLASKNMGSA